MQGVQGVGAGRIRGEGPLDVGRPLQIVLDRADLPALTHLPDVEVAQRCQSGGAALLGFGVQPFSGLGGEVGGVELRVGREDPKRAGIKSEHSPSSTPSRLM